MKKLVLIFLTSTFLLFYSSLFSPVALAECDPATGINCFSCTYTGIACVVGIDNCQPGFENNISACSLHDGDMAACQLQINNECIETDPGSCYECVDAITGCIPRDAGDPRCGYDDFDSCNAACLGPPPTSTPTSSAPPPPAGPGGGCIDTAIGCIDVTGPEGFTRSILNVAVGVAGGIAILLIILGAFQVTTAAGNPEKIQGGQQLITSAIAGLLVVVFAVFLLRLIGADILKIPGFSP